MLAARARGLGTVWTTAQGPLEVELADALGVPHGEVMLAAFIPLALTVRTDFEPAGRIPREQGPALGTVVAESRAEPPRLRRHDYRSRNFSPCSPFGRCRTG
ncbi:hypothetical protein [Streptomyces sp. NPDC098090]